MSVDAILKQAKSTQPDLIAQREHCGVSLSVVRALSLTLGQQIRVQSGSVRCLFTVALYLDDEGAVVRMGKAGRDRFGQEVIGPVTVIDEVTSTVGDRESQLQSEFVERFVDGGENALIALAPHGGAIETNTDVQAEALARDLPGSCSWVCRGYQVGGGAYDRWHITSTDLHRASFPMLAAFYPRRRFMRAVAFHGHEGDDVLIGGLAPIALQTKIATALVARGIRAELAPASRLGGSSPSNLCNRVTVDGQSGIQIEQPLSVRLRRWKVVVEVVFTVLRNTSP